MCGLSKLINYEISSINWVCSRLRSRGHNEIYPRWLEVSAKLICCMRSVRPQHVGADCSHGWLFALTKFWKFYYIWILGEMKKSSQTIAEKTSSFIFYTIKSQLQECWTCAPNHGVNTQSRRSPCLNFLSLADFQPEKRYIAQASSWAVFVHVWSVCLQKNQSALVYLKNNNSNNAKLYPIITST